MSGLELMLSAALCLTCVPSNTVKLPEGLILLSNNENITTDNPVDISIDDASFQEPSINIEGSLTQKQQHLKRLREWINGRHLRIATLEDFPLSYTMHENGTRMGRGVSFEIIEFLREKYNFTYEVVIPNANIIGSTGDYSDSLIELLNNSNVDLAAAFVPLLTDARAYIYYSTTTLDEGEWIMVMQRPRESATGSGLLAPFDFWVWILILISLLAVGPIIYLLIILRNKLTGDVEQKPYSLGHCAWFVYGALMKQGSILSPIADSTRLLFATWWIFITILTSFYTANLTAFLTLSKFTLPYNTVNDILYKNKHFVSSRGGGIEYSIKNTNETLSMLYKMTQNNHAVFSDNTNDSLNLQNYVEKDGYVFVRDRPAINHVLYRDYRYRRAISIDNEKIHCPFAMAKEPFLKKKRSFAYPIGSKLSQLFDPELLNLVESGIVKHLSAENLPNAEICPQNLGSTERQLRNGDLMLTYYIMVAGFATAIVVFSTEIIFRYLNARQNNNNWSRHGVGRTPNGLLLTPSRWLTDVTNKKEQHSVSQLNVTPPPPYQSIFSGTKKINNIISTQHWRNQTEDVGVLRYGGLEGNTLGSLETTGGVRRMINGRDYIVFRNQNGQSQLVPIRAPSAALFQYTYTE